MISALTPSDINGLNSLPPESWNLDYEAFLKDFMQHDFFFPFVLLQENCVVGTGNVFIQEKNYSNSNIPKAGKERFCPLKTRMEFSSWSSWD